MIPVINMLATRAQSESSLADQLEKYFENCDFLDNQNINAIHSETNIKGSLLRSTVLYNDLKNAKSHFKMLNSLLKRNYFLGGTGNQCVLKYIYIYIYIDLFYIMDELVTISHNNIIHNGIISMDKIQPFPDKIINVEHLGGMIDIARTRHGILNHILCLLRSMGKFRRYYHQ